MQSGLTIIETPSPNFDERALPISMIVLHYTGMQDAASAIAQLANPDAKVSAHYVVAEDGQIIRMVAEDKRAWHAGRSHWRGVTDINSASIGIEIVNPGHEFGYRPFPDEQIDALIPLVADIMATYTSRAAMSSAIRTSRPRASAIPANSSRGDGLRGCASRCPGRPGT